MKSLYFTSNALDAQARQMLEKLPRRRIGLEKLERPALLALDMQEYFLNPESHAYVPSAPAILPGIQQLVERFLKKGYPVIFTRHTNTPEDAGMMAVWWRNLLTREHPFANLSSEVDASRAEVIEKTQYDAFYNTGLAEKLKTAQVTDVVISGVMTHLCCECTARTAFVLGWRVWFLVDGTATYNEEYHLGTLQALAHGFASPILVSELLGAL